MKEEELPTGEEELPEGVIELVDDFGKTVKFRLFDVTEYKNEKYALLLPAEESGDGEEDEILIFRYDEKNQNLETIEDENLLQEVFDFYRSEAEEEDGGEN